jgi:hypothetical protein
MFDAFKPLGLFDSEDFSFVTLFGSYLDDFPEFAAAHFIYLNKITLQPPRFLR